MYKTGEVVLANLHYTDTFEIKSRPAVVLFEELGNVVVAGITSNTKMQGVKLSKKDGAVKDSVIKTNYIFTISELMVSKKLFSLSKEKKKELYESLDARLKKLVAAD